MAKWKTWISDAPEETPPQGANLQPGSGAPLPPRQSYDRFEEIPAGVRQAIRLAAESGLTTEHLEKIFELPADWIEMCVRRPH